MADKNFLTMLTYHPGTFYNFVTDDYDPISVAVTKEDLADYVPQDVESLSIYDAYISQGLDKAVALANTYKVLIAHKLKEINSESENDSI